MKRSMKFTKLHTYIEKLVLYDNLPNFLELEKMILADGFRWYIVNALGGTMTVHSLTDWTYW